MLLRGTKGPVAHPHGVTALEQKQINEDKKCNFFELLLNRKLRMIIQIIQKNPYFGIHCLERKRW